MSKRNRNIVILVGAVALLMIVAIVGGRAHRSPAIAVKQTTIKYATFETKLPENGVLQRPRLQLIPAQISGNIGNIYVRAGEYVTQGQLLATLQNAQILSGAAGASAGYSAAVAHARSAAAGAVSSVAQAQANLESARARLTQAQQDLANGSQSGLGYGGSTAADQKAQADAQLATAASNLNEARRIYLADQDLFNNKAISRDTLDQARAKYEQTQISYNQAKLARTSLGAQLSRGHQVLIDNLRSAQQAYAQAQAALSAARVQSGSGDVAAANADVLKAQSDYEYASAQAQATQVRAPFSGVLLGIANESTDTLRPLQPGDTVTQGQTLFTMSGNEGFVVRAKVDEQDIINVRLGQRATITGEDFPGKTLSGHVIAISPLAQRSDDPSSTSRQVITTIRLDSSPSYLRDGMSVDVDILTTDITHTIVLPKAAIIHDGKKTYVYVVQGERAHKVPVTLGTSNDTNAIVRAGLHPGDRVITENNAAVNEGTPVTPAPSPSPQPS